jgi:hypothetical protein
MGNYYDCLTEGIDLTYVKIYAKRYFNFDIDIDNKDLEDVDVLIAFIEEVQDLLEEMYRIETDINAIQRISMAYSELYALLNRLLDREIASIDIETKEQHAAVLINQILGNIEAIERVGNLFGIRLYDITKEDLYDAEFVDIFASMINELNKDMYYSEAYENYVDDEDAVIEVFVAINTLQKILQVIRDYKEQF